MLLTLALALTLTLTPALALALALALTLTKVCLGWVEGIADRITGLDATERRLERDVHQRKA